MAEKFTFDVNASVDAINKVLNIAENFKDEAGFIGELAKALIGLKGLINKADYINLLNEKLITCREISGLKLERVWDGGFQNFGDIDNTIRLHRLALFFSIYLKEFSFRHNFRIDTSHDLYHLISLVRNNRHEFIERSEWCLEVLDNMPTYIMQEEFHSDHSVAFLRAISSTDIVKVEDFINTRDDTVRKIDDWNNDYQNKLAVVEALKEKLETYQTAFNFVGLYQGFLKLSENKLKELNSLKIQYYVLGGLLLALPIVELCYVFSKLDQLDLSKVIFLVIPTLTLLLILFWFFRIILSEIRAIKSQIMQLELRMTLCQFIQSYADSSKDLKEKNPNGFDKFENLIFSSIVSSDDKIPSTFDGMEHLSNLLGVLKKD